MAKYDYVMENDNEQTEFEKSGLDSVALEFMRYEDRVIKYL